MLPDRSVEHHEIGREVLGARHSSGQDGPLVDLMIENLLDMQPFGCLICKAAKWLHVTPQKEQLMADIMHRVGIEAPQQQVYDTLTTIEGISQWWTREVGEATPYPGELKVSSWG
jgi:hypothetical protein